MPVRPGQTILEVGCGTGVVLRDLATRVGPRGRVVGVDPSRALLRAAGRILRDHPQRRRIVLRAGDGQRLPFPTARFDAAMAVTVLLHVPAPLRVVEEMTRVVRSGGVVVVQDQDFGTVAVTHPDRALTRRILDGVAERLYAEPWSGRRLVGLLRAAGLEHVRLRTDVFQDTVFDPYTQGFLDRRAQRAVAFGLVGEREARHWLEGFADLVAGGSFVFTMNYYGVVGVKPTPGQRR